MALYHIREKKQQVFDDTKWAISQFCAQLPGLKMQARLEVALFWYKPHCFFFHLNAG